MLPLRGQAAPCASGAGSNPLWTHGNPHIREPPREAAELLLQDASSSPKRQPQQSSQASPGGEILNRNTKIGRNAAGMGTCTCEEALGEAAEPGLPEQPVLITGDTVPTALLPRHCAPEDRGGMHRLWRDHGLYTPVRQRRRLLRGRPCTHCQRVGSCGTCVRLCCPPRSTETTQDASTAGAPPAAGGSRRVSQVLHILFSQALPSHRVWTEPEPRTPTAVPATVTATTTITSLQTAPQNAGTRDSRCTWKRPFRRSVPSL